MPFDGRSVEGIDAMKIQTVAPHAALAEYVQHYYNIEVEIQDSKQPQYILPGVSFDLIIQVGRETYYKDGTKTWQKREPQGFIEGPCNRHFQLRFAPDTRIYGIAFKPLGILPLLKTDLTQFSNLFTDVKSVFNQAGRELVYRIQDAKGFGEVVELFNNFLLNTLNHQLRPKQHVVRAYEMLATSSGGNTISKLTKEIFVSERKLQRDFKEQTGITMERMSQSMRYRKALSLIHQENKLGLEEISHHVGYYDASHLINDIKKITGLTISSAIGQKTMISRALIDFGLQANS